MSIETDISTFIRAQFAPDVAADQLDADFDLLDNGVVDSLQLLRLIAWIGERFDVPVNEVEIAPDNFRSINAIRAFIEISRVPSARTI